MWELTIIALCVGFYFLGLKIGTANERIRQRTRQQRRHDPYVIDFSQLRDDEPVEPYFLDLIKRRWR